MPADKSNEPNSRNPDSTLQRIDVVCDEFEAALIDGKQPRIEDFLAGSGEPSVLLPELLALEIDYRRKASETPKPQDYETRFPDQKGVVRQAFAEQSTIAVGATRYSDQRPQGNFAGYELIDEIARGGMGVVFKARQQSPDRLVALKMILSGQLAGHQEVRRFHVEADAAAHLEHPNIVPIYEVGEHEGRHFFSMAYVDGSSLAAQVTQGPLPPHDAANIVKTITAAISYAHDRGVIHRDLKPANILIDQNGQPRVTDFGLARKIEADSGLTGTGQVLGTPSYMPPEQASGELDRIGPASDIYALGAILYCMLTGRPPFQAASPFDTILQVIEQEPVAPRQLNPNVDVDIETVCLKCLQKDPGRRYASASELGADLTRFLNHEPVQARHIGRVARIWRWCQRKPLVAGLGATVAVSVVVGLVFSTYFAVKAGQRAQQAEAAVAIAVSTLERTITDVQTELRSIPAAREIRRKLLRNALEDLQRVSGEMRSQRRVDHNTARALIDLSRLFNELGDEKGLNAAATVETNLTMAIDIFRQLSADQPEDIGLRQELAGALNDLGELYVMTRRGALAQPPLFEALVMGQEISKNSNLSTKWHLVFSWILTNCGDWHTMKSDFRSALPYFSEAERIVRPLVDAQPTDFDFQLRLAECVERSGDAHHDLGENEQALACFKTSFKISEMMLAKEPDSSFWQASMGFSHERLGNHWFQVGDREKAREHYLKMMEFNTKALELDPASLNCKEGVRYAQLKLARVGARLPFQPTNTSE